MRDLVRNFDKIVCEVYELNCEERLEEKFGDIMYYVYWKSSAGCWSKAQVNNLCTQLLSQLNEKMLAMYIIIPRGY